MLHADGGLPVVSALAPATAGLSGLYVVLGIGLPNARLLIWRHSPFSSGLVRSQSGVKSVSMSFHWRVTDCTVRCVGIGRIAVGARVGQLLDVLRERRLERVFPFPKRSYANSQLGRHVIEARQVAGGEGNVPIRGIDGGSQRLRG